MQTFESHARKLVARGRSTHGASGISISFVGRGDTDGGLVTTAFATRAELRRPSVSGILHVDSRERAAAHLIGRALFVTSLARPTNRERFSRRCLHACSRSRRARGIHALDGDPRLGGVRCVARSDIATAQCADAQFREALRSIARTSTAGFALGVRRTAARASAHRSRLIRAGERAGALDEASSIWQRDERERAVKTGWRRAGISGLVTVRGGRLWLLIAQTAPALPPCSRR